MRIDLGRLAAIILIGVAVGVAGCGRPDRGGGPEEKKRPAPAEGTDRSGPGTRGEATPGSDGVKQYDAPPPMAIDPEKHYAAVVKTTKGEFKIELFAAESPKTVNNFVFLARDGFYNGVKFHRIIREFMVQTGDPRGDGTGGPGYTIEDELPPKRRYEEGIVAMANAGAPHSGGSQFFICTGPVCRGLDAFPYYTQFGRVTEGMDVVQEIAATPVERDPRSGEESVPKEDVRILAVTIEER